MVNCCLMSVYLNFLFFALIQFEFSCIHQTYRLTERLQSKVSDLFLMSRTKIHLFTAHFPHFYPFFCIFWLLKGKTIFQVVYKYHDDNNVIRFIRLLYTYSITAKHVQTFLCCLYFLFLVGNTAK